MQQTLSSTCFTYKLGLKGLASKSVEHKKDINDECQRNQNHQGTNCCESIPTPTTQYPQLDLNQVNQSHHQEPTPENRPECRNEYAGPQRGRVKMPHGDAQHLITATATDPNFTAAFANLDGLFESQGDEAGEEEGAEGVDVEGHEVFCDCGAGYAPSADEGGGGVVGGVPREAEEEREGEERVDVEDAVQGHDVDGRWR